MVINEIKLKELLKAKGLTKSALCQAINISSKTVAKISKGESVGDKVATKIANFLGVEPSQLVATNVILETLQKEIVTPHTD